jgi:hypothetical protein
LLTVSSADWVSPAAEAEIVATAFSLDANVVMSNPALVSPSGTVTLDSTAATPLSLLERLIAVPPEGASSDSPTVPAEGVPDVTLAGSTLRKVSATGAG